jgi:hypothetical protein
MNQRAYLVVTSIAEDRNPVLLKLAEGAVKHGVGFIIIGDQKSPSSFCINGTQYLSIEQQEQLGYKLAKTLPKNHYSRKNIGYLEAITKGAEVIVETDDDNIPYESFWIDRLREKSAIILSGAGWVNVYSYFTPKKIWPRGYPLELIKEHGQFNDKLGRVISPIQQSLADGNPDVDAIYRFIGELPITFDVLESDIAITNGVMSPFNSQNTTWFKEAFPLLYLPSFCSFRMTDIYRSFIANRVSWEYDWPIIFTNSTVLQERNAHNILKDFEDEVHGYINYNKIYNVLLDLKLSKKHADILKNMTVCYEGLIKAKLMDVDEIELLKSWGDDLKSILL